MLGGIDPTIGFGACNEGRGSCDKVCDGGGAGESGILVLTGVEFEPDVYGEGFALAVHGGLKWMMYRDRSDDVRVWLKQSYATSRGDGGTLALAWGRRKLDERRRG
jgi:hypothetical protein